MSEPTGAPERATSYAPREIAYFQQRLLEERKRALRDLARIGELMGTSLTAADGDLTDYPFHPADQGTDTMEQEKNFLLASQEGRLVWHIDEALRRLYRTPEAFGRCESCERRIPFERLDALPQARFCVGCKQREEEGQATA